MFLQRFFYCVAVILCLTALPEGQEVQQTTETEATTENEKNTQLFETKTFIMDAPTKTIKVKVEVDVRKELAAECKRFIPEVAQIRDAQKNLSLSLNKLTLDQKKLETEIVEEINKLKLEIISSKNILLALKEELRQLKPVAEFDENLNCTRNCGNVKNLPNDCSETLDEEQKESGVYLLKPHGNGAKAFGAYCERQEGKSWTIIQRRQDGSVDFFRNWQNYKNGFGNVDGEYWLGLDRIHALTSKKKYELWLKMESFGGTIKNARYSTFSIADESQGYKLTIAGFSGNAVDSLIHNNNEKFSTFDVDNDKWAGNSCANNRKGAWWYWNCTFCNGNGIYQNRTTNTAIYCDHSALYHPLKYFHMAIRPN